MNAAIIYIILTVLLVGCISPYEEGPRVTLRSKKNNIVGTWVPVEYENQGVEYTYTFQRYNDLTLDYNFDGVPYQFEMEWRFGSQGDLVTDFYNDKLDIDIVLLTENEMVWFDEITNVRTTFYK